LTVRDVIIAGREDGRKHRSLILFAAPGVLFFESRNRPSEAHGTVSAAGGKGGTGGLSIRIARVVPLFSLIVLSGCAHVISGNLRAEARKDLTFPMVLADPKAYGGATVVWGGEILDTRNRKGGTEFVVLETPLEYGDFPADREDYEGRFIARTPRFLDPAIFARGLKITVAGTIAGEETRPLGEMEYRYPVLEIRELHLWTPAPPIYSWPYPPDYPWSWRYGFWCPWPGCL
jgi:outer membrane lipoprotein